MNEPNQSSPPGEIEILVIPFIEGRISDLKALVYQSRNISAYMKFVSIPQIIEFLGACLDDEEFNCPSQSNNRFDSITEHYLGNIDRKYKTYSGHKANPSLYFHFRCGLIHQLRPTGGVVFTTRKEADDEGNSHLEKTLDGYLILVLEDLFDDIEKVSKMVIEEIQNEPVKLNKWIDPFISIIDNS